MEDDGGEVTEGAEMGVDDNGLSHEPRAPYYHGVHRYIPRYLRTMYGYEHSVHVYCLKQYSCWLLIRRTPIGTLS